MALTGLRASPFQHAPPRLVPAAEVERYPSAPPAIDSAIAPRSPRRSPLRRRVRKLPTTCGGWSRERRVKGMTERAPGPGGRGSRSSASAETRYLHGAARPEITAPGGGVLRSYLSSAGGGHETTGLHPLRRRPTGERQPCVPRARPEQVTASSHRPPERRWRRRRARGSRPGRERLTSHRVCGRARCHADAFRGKGASSMSSRPDAGADPRSHGSEHELVKQQRRTENWGEGASPLTGSLNPDVSAWSNRPGDGIRAAGGMTPKIYSSQDGASTRGSACHWWGVDWQ